jgi:hypothetical protein
MHPKGLSASLCLGLQQHSCPMGIRARKSLGEPSLRAPGGTSINAWARATLPRMAIAGSRRLHYRCDDGWSSCWSELCAMVKCVQRA